MASSTAAPPTDIDFGTRHVDSDNEVDPDHPTLAQASAGGHTTSSTVGRTGSSAGRLTNTSSAEFYRQTIEPRHRAVYDAYGNEIGYNKGLPHKRHPETAAAMDRFISMTSSSASSFPQPSTESFNQLVRTQSKSSLSGHSPDSALHQSTLEGSPSLVIKSPSGTLTPSGPNGPKIKDAKPESEAKLPWYERAADKIMGRRHVEKKSRLGRVVSRPAVSE